MPPRVAYSLFMALSLVVFLLVRQFMAQPANYQCLSRHQRLAIALAAFIGGALGGKLPWVFADGTSWLRLNIWLADGKTITTGLIGAYVAVELAKLALGVRVKTGDAFALPLALALAVGRWGCFFNGCCYGTPTTLPWGVRFQTAIGTWEVCHPTQIYEIVFHLGIAIFLWQCLRSDWLRNRQLKFYLIGYCVFRFLVEFIRPEPIAALGLTFYQWVCLAFANALAFQWALGQPPVLKNRNLASSLDAPSLQ